MGAVNIAIKVTGVAKYFTIKSRLFTFPLKNGYAISVISAAKSVHKTIKDISENIEPSAPKGENIFKLTILIIKSSAPKYLKVNKSIKTTLKILNAKSSLLVILFLSSKYTPISKAITATDII
jgi:hypothetical protein